MGYYTNTQSAAPQQQLAYSAAVHDLSEPWVRVLRKSTTSKPTCFQIHPVFQRCFPYAPTSQYGSIPDGGVGANLHVTHHIGIGSDKDVVALERQHNMLQRRHRGHGWQVHHLAARGRAALIQLGGGPGQIGLNCRTGLITSIPFSAPPLI
eukprot:773837-Pelagomonas_calceolata.AAC.6